jgi:phosphatidylinositol alpha-1,6-mannosyltransferase
LDPRGGGVAAVSRLLWQVFRDRWGDECRLVTLLDDGQEMASLESTQAMRLRFGARLAKEQVLGESGWTLYSHLSLAQVQAFIPTALGRPYGIFLHGIEAWRPLSRTQRGVIEGAQWLIANSQYTADRIAGAHPWIGPIAACPLALSPGASRDSAPAETESAAARLGPHLVLVVARMSSSERYKGHDELLEAWPAVVAQIPDAQLVFAGEGDDAPRLAAKANAFHVDRSVVFSGFVSTNALESLYRHAAVFAMPSRDEGFGLVYLEAMSHQLPCIGSTHDAARETIEHGVSGFLVEQRDVPALSALLVRVLADDAMRREMGRQGLRRLQQHFTYPRFRDRLTSLLSTTPDSVGTLAIPAGSR